MLFACITPQSRNLAQDLDFVPGFECSDLLLFVYFTPFNILQVNVVNINITKLIRAGESAELSDSQPLSCAVTLAVTKFPGYISWHAFFFSVIYWLKRWEVSWEVRKYIPSWCAQTISLCWIQLRLRFLWNTTDICRKLGLQKIWP